MTITQYSPFEYMTITGGYSHVTYIFIENELL